VDDSREFRGLCKPKIESCNNGTWLVVQEEVRSIAEVPCNGHDDDCDGFTDEDTYRGVERLSWIDAAVCFAQYALRALWKYRRF
jgi:hypothetical protein